MARKRLQTALGANYPVGNEQITIFIPSKNRIGENIDQEYWTRQALLIMGQLFRGATSFPPGRGVWRDDEREGALLEESTVMVISYVPTQELEKSINKLRVFLHAFGRETNQGEVGLIVSGDYYGISVYDNA